MTFSAHTGSKDGKISSWSNKRISLRAVGSENRLLFIADDAGLGKTIESGGLIARTSSS
jgi:hypothetical protein